jgi:hypothetical protein
MNWLMYTLDRGTHLKIVLVGLSAAVLISVIAFSANNLNLGTDIMAPQPPTVVKAGGPVIFTKREGPLAR